MQMHCWNRYQSKIIEFFKLNSRSVDIEQKHIFNSSNTVVQLNVHVLFYFTHFFFRHTIIFLDIQFFQPNRTKWFKFHFCLNAYQKKKRIYSFVYPYVLAKWLRIHKQIGRICEKVNSCRNKKLYSHYRKCIDRIDSE